MEASEAIFNLFTAELMSEFPAAVVARISFGSCLQTLQGRTSPKYWEFWSCHPPGHLSGGVTGSAWSSRDLYWRIFIYFFITPQCRDLFWGIFIYLFITPLSRDSFEEYYFFLYYSMVQGSFFRNMYLFLYYFTVQGCFLRTIYLSIYLILHCAGRDFYLLLHGVAIRWHPVIQEQNLWHQKQDPDKKCLQMWSGVLWSLN